MSCLVDTSLCRMTDKRMADNGISLDLVCLSKHPLHSVPLLKLVNDIARDSNSKESLTAGRNHADKSRIISFLNQTPSLDAYEEDYYIPNWIDCIHWSRPTESSHFVPRCSN